MLRIAHLSTTHQGGAGIASRYLAKSLNSHGIYSVFYSLASKSFSLAQNELRIRRSLRSVAGSKLATLINISLSKDTFFSLFSGAQDDLRLSNLRNFDIIHLHNYYNMLSIRTLVSLQSLSIPLVFTLHDQRLFTGGCHYTLDCKQFETDCESCPRIPQIFSPRVYSNLDNLRSQLCSENLDVIAPSRWMLDQGMRSSLLSSSRFHHIENTLPLPIPIQESFKQSSNTRDKFAIFGVASMDPFSRIKGGKFLLSLLSKIDKFQIPARVLFMRDVTQSNIEKDFWNKIDFLLVPSKMDNSPNVLREAGMRGIPVVATRVGGIPELLDEKFDTLVEDNEEGENFLLSFLKRKSYLRTPEQRSNRSLHSKIKNQEALHKHIDLYHKLVG